MSAGDTNAYVMLEEKGKDMQWNTPETC